MRQPKATVDPGTLIAMGGLLLGWFAMATLVMDFGLLQQSVRFYDLLAVINDPAGKLSGFNSSQPVATLGFGLLCVVAVVAPIVPLFWKRRVATLTYLIPLILMAASFALLYAKTSTSHVPADDTAHTVSAYLARAAAKAATRAGDYAATRISIGAGTYVAFISSCYLAVRGVSKFRAARIVSQPSPPQARI